MTSQAITMTVLKTTNGYVVVQANNPQPINANQLESATNCADLTATGTTIASLMTAAFTASA